MKTVLLSTLLAVLSLTVFAQCSDSLLGGGSIRNNYNPWAAMDNAENLYLQGTYDSAATFSSISISTTKFRNGVFLNRYNTDRSIAFSKTVAESKGSFKYSAMTLSPNCIYIADRRTDSVYINSAYYAPKSSFHQIIFLVKTDLGGNVVWQKVFQYKDQLGNSPSMAITSDTHGNVYMAGVFTDTLQLDTFRLTNAISFDKSLFICKISSTGNVLWAKQTNGASNNWAYPDNIYIMPNGKLIVSGIYHGHTDFGGTYVGGSTAVVSASIAPFAVCLDTLSGNVNWLWNATTSSANVTPYATSVSDTANNTYITGSLNDSTSFGSIKLVGKGQMYFAKISSSGNIIWAKLKPGKLSSANEMGEHLTLNSKGQIVLTGYFSDSTYFGATKYISQGGVDFFINIYDTSGNLQNVNCYGSSGNDIAYYSIVHQNDSVAFGGIFNSPALNINGKSLNNKGIGSYNIFVYDPCAHPSNIPDLNNRNSFNFNVYPNPSRGFFEIKLDKALTSDGTLVLTDITGKPFYKTIIKKGNDHYNYTNSQLSPGIYLIELKTEENRITNRLVIQ